MKGKQDLRKLHIWQAVVDYANGDAVYRKLFDKLIPDGTQFAGLDQIDELSGLFSSPSGDLEKDFVTKAAGYQTEFRKMLTWLCDPQHNRHLRIGALKFIQAGAKGVHWDIDIHDDPTDEFATWNIYFLKQVRFKSVMSPTCKFILDRMEEANEGNSRAVPIQMCQREGCGRFFLPQRTGRKQFCSAKCVQAAHQPSKEYTRNNVFLHRLGKLSAGQRRKALAKPETKKRLREIV
jgi:hypothetical protein